MPYSKRFEEAFAYANRLHDAQVRKATNIPYITHVMSVAGIVADYGGSEDQVIAALLHDVVEDQGGRPRLEEVRQRFGKTVADIVEACSDTDQVPKPSWYERKVAYIDHLDTAPAEALLVCAADKLHNARTIVQGIRSEGLSVFDRFSADKKDMLWYYRRIVSALAGRERNALVIELERAVADMHRWGYSKEDECEEEHSRNAPSEGTPLNRLRDCETAERLFYYLPIEERHRFLREIAERVLWCFPLNRPWQPEDLPNEPLTHNEAQWLTFTQRLLRCLPDTCLTEEHRDEIGEWVAKAWPDGPFEVLFRSDVGVPKASKELFRIYRRNRPREDRDFDLDDFESYVREWRFAILREIENNQISDDDDDRHSRYAGYIR